MAHMWFMHDGHSGRAFLFLDILAEYTLPVNDSHGYSMCLVCSWNEVGDVLCEVSSSPFCTRLLGKCRKKSRDLAKRLQIQLIRFERQAAWYRMENGPKSKNWKRLAKIENGPRPEMGKKRPKNGEKMGFGVTFPFFCHFWAIFSPFRAEGHYLFFAIFFQLHSIPGGLTRKLRCHFCTLCST